MYLNGLNFYGGFIFIDDYDYRSLIVFLEIGSTYYFGLGEYGGAVALFNPVNVTVINAIFDSNFGSFGGAIGCVYSAGNPFNNTFVFKNTIF